MCEIERIIKLKHIEDGFDEILVIVKSKSQGRSSFSFGPSDCRNMEFDCSNHCVDLIEGFDGGFSVYKL